MPLSPEQQKLYLKKYLPRYRSARRADAIVRLGGKCARCGGADNLEFDHVDRTTKIKAIGRLWTSSKAIFEAELAKCQLLCKACHRVKSIECGDVNVAVHGSDAMYKLHKCRCIVCVGEQNQRMREYKKKSRARQMVSHLTAC